MIEPTSCLAHAVQEIGDDLPARWAGVIDASGIVRY